MDNCEDADDILARDCPSRRMLDLLTDKWTVLVIKALAQGSTRFGQLQRRIGGISPKMLTQTLRVLERDGLVRRMVYGTMPPVVEYALTTLGMTLVEPVEAMTRWAQGHLADVDRARSEYAEAREATLVGSV